MSHVKGIIFDIDGVLEFQGKVYPGAIETLAGLREQGVCLRFLTNSTLKSRRSCTEKLVRRGFEAHEQEVITASYATAAYLRRLKPRSCWVMAAREGVEEFHDFVIDDRDPEYVVVGDCRDGFNFDNLNAAVRMLLHGAKLIGMQGELLDTSMGDVELNVGSWVGMLERACGRPAVYIGKPNPFVFELALEAMRLEKSDVLMIGDRVHTDIVGARNVGLRSALVRTGEFDPRELEGEIQPDFILESVRELPEILR